MPSLLLLALLALLQPFWGQAIAADESNMETITWKLCPPAVSKVREGSEALIRCAAKTDSEVPNTNVYRWEWQKTKGVFSPIRLSPSAKYWYDSETSAKVGDLKIRSVDRDDTGQLLSCLRGARTASKLILCHRKSTLSVYWVNPIVSVRQLQPVRPPRQGESVRLLCNVEASEEPAAVNWFLNGKLLQPVDQSLYAIVGRELAIRNLSYATLGLYHCYAEMQPGDKLFSREPRPVLPEDMVSFFGPPVIYAKGSSADEAAASDLVELKAEFPASFAVTWYRFTDIGLEPSKEPIAATDPNVQRVGNNLLLRAGSWRRFATRMNLLGGRVTFGYFFMCHGVDLAAKRMGYYVYQIIPAQAPPLSELDNFEPPLSRVRIVRAGSDFVQRVYLNVSGDTVAEDSAASGWAPLPTAVWKDPGGVAVAADGSLSNSRLSVIRNYSLRIRDAKPEDSGVYDLLLSNQAGRASAQLHLLVSTPPLLSKVNQTIAANESSVLFIDCLQPGDSVSPPPATEFSWYRLDPGGGNPSLVATSGTAGADSGSRILQLPPQQASVHAENGRLIIHNLSVDASGQYVCLAVTRLSEPGAILEQQDKEFARNTSGTVRLRVIPALRLCPNLANTVFVELKTQHVIDCPWSGLEQPSIAWYRLYPNGRRRRLPTSVGVELSKNNTRLTIHMSDPEFSGSYLIQANSSSQGTVTKRFSIVVGRRPVFDLISPNRTVTPGASVWLHCRASGSPPPLISWTLRRPGRSEAVIYDRTNSRPVPSASQRVVLFENGSLLINRMSQMDAGNYHCLAGTPFRVAQVLTSLQLSSSLGSEGPGSESLTRTIAIVVSCSLGYLFLIIFLSMFCTLRRRKRRSDPAEQAAGTAPVAASSVDSRQSPGLSSQLQHQQLLQQSQRLYRQLQQPPHSPSHSSSPGGAGATQKIGGFFPLQQRQDSCYESATSRGSGPEQRPLLTQQPPQALQPLDSRSLTSDASYGSYSFGRRHTNTPANSVAESTLDRLAREHPVDRKQLVYGQGILGRGLFGQVRTAQLDGKPVFVKELTCDTAPNRYEFTEQVKMFTYCTSEFVTRLVGLSLDAGPIADSCPIIVLEYCENGNLYNRLVDMRNRTQQYPAATLLRMSHQAALALHSLHSLGFVHGDVGCRNLLVAPDDTVKLTNLGPCLDRFCGQYGQVESGLLLPLRWTAPEALARRHFGVKADVWSLGVTIGEIFTSARQPLPQLATDADVLAAAATVAAAQLTSAGVAAAFCPVPSPEALSSAPAVRALIERCCSLSQDRRPTAGIVAGQLAEILRTSPTAPDC
ncbi:hypothetical protein BOX15_Mlig011020g2 [Macrostomum lignano]|uniref:Receptor protein-tyrosine kinase n=1 Tax=Macrostomum lignano TaxID=282301 RepID=A0A267GJI6_9PLAT|nr:hypothetical protein BOX15_Mlig011020g2 [Macrostomum lignano]